MSKPVRVPLLGALLLLLAAALIAALLPAGIALDRRVAAELRSSAVEDLGRAPMILADRNTVQEEALVMHARSVADTEGLMAALGSGRFDEAAALAGATASMYGEQPVIISADGASVVGPTLGAATLDAIRDGGSLVEYVYEDGMPHAVGIVGLASDDGWMGAAGSSTRLDENQMTALSALSRSDVTIVSPNGALVSSTLEGDRALAVVAAEEATVRVPEEKVVEVSVDAAPTWIARGELSGAGTVLFSRDVDQELAALPAVRRGAALAAFLAVVLALGVGWIVALALTRPVQGLAVAAGRLAEGDFESPVPASRIDEVDRLGGAFRMMRTRLRDRIDELAIANRQLEDKQQRLQELQAELIRQDRVASSARMAAELAHEIRNPVANVRNCLEVVRRGMPEGSEGSRFADMAIDELLRMHEMAEHLLDLNRPADPDATTCDAAEVAGQVATLASVGEASSTVELTVDPDAKTAAAIPPDALKQVLFNLVDNAKESGGADSPVEIHVRATNGSITLAVLDGGNGIPEDILGSIFDPFFTTKDAVTGVGLGLSVAQGIMRRHGGRLEAANRADGPGACFTVEVPGA